MRFCDHSPLVQNENHEALNELLLRSRIRFVLQSHEAADHIGSKAENMRKMNDLHLDLQFLLPFRADFFHDLKSFENAEHFSINRFI